MDKNWEKFSSDEETDEFENQGSRAAYGNVTSNYRDFDLTTTEARSAVYVNSFFNDWDLTKPAGDASNSGQNAEGTVGSGFGVTKTPDEMGNAVAIDSNDEDWSPFGGNGNNVAWDTADPSEKYAGYDDVPFEVGSDANLTTKGETNSKKPDRLIVTVDGIPMPRKIETFKSSGLHEVLIMNSENMQYLIPTPIQKFALPIIMDGRDMIANSQTGSGKTAAIILSILHCLLRDAPKLILDHNHCEPHVIFIVPTKELAVQTWKIATKLSQNTGIRCELLYGGTSRFNQKQKILAGCNIVVATIGRLIDFINSGYITCSSLKFFVLDEADHLLRMGLQQDIEQVLHHHTMVSSEEKTTIMISATLNENIKLMAEWYLKPDHVLISVGMVGEAFKDITQTILEVNKFDKKKTLISVLNESKDCSGTLVFVQQKRQADFIAAFLSELNYPATSIHGDRYQSQREQALRDFRTKKMSILVATSVAAKGLNQMDVSMVVNFDLPKSVEEYVHRIGRTGRLGNVGKAISFYDPINDYPLGPGLVKTLKLANQTIPPFLMDFDNVYYDEDSDVDDNFGDAGKDATVPSGRAAEPSGSAEDDE